MKYFLIILGLTITFFSQAQTVCVPDKVADYFLEQNERAKQLDVLVYRQDTLILNQKKQLALKDSIIQTQRNDSTLFRKIIGTKNNELAFKDKDLQVANKEVKRQKRIKVAIIVGEALKDIAILIILL